MMAAPGGRTWSGVNGALGEDPARSLFRSDDGR